MIEMTRQEYEKKFGKQPDIPSYGTSSDTFDIVGRTQGGRPVEPNEYGASFRATGKENPLEAGLKAAGNLPSSAYNLGKGIYQAVTNPVQTFTGIVSATKGAGEAAGREILQASGVERIPEKSIDEKTFNTFVDYFKGRYGSLESAQKTAIEDPVGLATDLLSVLQGGAAAAGKAGVVPKIVSKVGGPASKVVSAPVAAIGKGIEEASTGAAGITTGVGREAFKQALQGGDDFTNAMRGGGNLAEVLGDARAGISQIKQMRSIEYNKAFDDIGMQNPQSFELTPLLSKRREVAAEFGIKKTAEGWDFSRSSLVNDKSKVEALFNLIDEWGTQGGDRTVRGIDNLKQQIRSFREGNNPALNKFVDELARSTQDIIKDVKGYKELQTKYGAYSDFLDEMERTLSLAENSTPDQAINKLNSLLRDNADYKRILVEEFKQMTGNDILAPVAGQALSKGTPQGLAKYLAGGAAISMPQLIPLLAFSSPRLMGEFFKLIGATNRTVGGILEAVNEFRVPNGLPKINVKK